MSMNGVRRLSPESINSMNDMKTWARDHEIYINSRMDQMEASIADNKKRGKRNSRFLLISVCLFGSTLAVVVLLSGITRIFGL